MHWHGQCHMEIGVGGLKRRVVGWLDGWLGWLVGWMDELVGWMDELVGWMAGLVGWAKMTVKKLEIKRK